MDINLKKALEKPDDIQVTFNEYRTDITREQILDAIKEKIFSFDSTENLTVLTLEKIRINLCIIQDLINSESTEELPITFNSDINTIYEKAIFSREEYQQLELSNRKLKDNVRVLSKEINELKEEHKNLKIKYEFELELGKTK